MPRIIHSFRRQRFAHARKLANLACMSGDRIATRVAQAIARIEAAAGRIAAAAASPRAIEAATGGPRQRSRTRSAAMRRSSAKPGEALATARPADRDARTMSNVTLEIAARNYTIACADGRGSAYRNAGRIDRHQAGAARQSGGPIARTRLLLYAALLLADELHEAKGNSAPAPAGLDEIGRSPAGIAGRPTGKPRNAA